MFRHIPEVEFAVLFRKAGDEKRFCFFRREGAVFSPLPGLQPAF